MLIRVCLLFLTSILLASCASNAIAPLMVTDQLACQVIKLKVRQELIINLPSNPSTGYSWSITQKPSFLKTVEADDYQQDPSANEGAVGVGGQSLWIFRAEAAGNDQLHLIYHRPWEKTEQPIKQFNCNVIVSE